MSASDGTEEKPTSTLFVRSLPFSTTDEQLEDVFSQIGPLQQCFVVKDQVHPAPGSSSSTAPPKQQQQQGKCKGYGFVRFATWKDAKRAKETIDTIGGRKIQVHYSKPRVGLKDRKGMPSKKVEGERQRIRGLLKGAEKEDVGVKDGVDGNEGSPPAKKPSQLPFHFIVNELPPLASGEDAVVELTNYFADVPGFDSVSADSAAAGDSKSAAFKIFFSTKHSAMTAKKTLLKKKKFKGTKLNLMSEAQEASLFANARKNRLIVRNLPFKIDEAGLAKAFGVHGRVQEVSIPKRADDPKKMLGFGFVQFVNSDQAGTALQAMNMSDLLGRKIAVDWAVPKKQFLVKSAPPTKTSSERDSAVEMDDEDEGSENEDGEEEGDDNDDDDSGSEEMKEDEDGSSDDDFDDDNDDDDNDDDDEEMEVESISKTDDFDREEWEKKKKVESGRDVEEGRTVFLRNVDFSIDENDLTNFAKQYGPVVLSRVVYDHATGHSKGCAFVQFQSKDGAEKCLEAAVESPGLRLGTQTMVANLALPKREAKKMTNEALRVEGKQPKDKRNLYLAREGFIRPGSDAAEGVSATDMNRRMKLVSLKKQKLKTTNFFISDTRLSVHNLPISCDEKKLKKIFLDAVVKNGVKGAQITECRIMRDGGRMSAAKAVGKSRGFGFVSFSHHDHALVALRHVNNNPEIIGEKRRLIVEFSVENAKALQIQEKRREKLKSAREAAAKKMNEPGEKGAAGKKGGKFVKNAVAPKEETALETASTQPHGGFQSEKGKPIQGLPKRLGAKMRHRDRKGKGKGGGGGAGTKPPQQQQQQPPAKNETNSQKPKNNSGGEKRNRNKKFKKGRKGEDKEERTFQNLVAKYKGGEGDKQKVKKSGKKWDA